METDSDSNRITNSFLNLQDTAIDKALERAVREALLMHRRAGNPVAVWREGKVVWLAADEVLNEMFKENGS